MADFQPIETAPKDGTVIGAWSAREPAIVRVVRWGRHLNGPKQSEGWVTITRAVTVSNIPTHWIALGPLPRTSGVRPSAEPERFVVADVAHRGLTLVTLRTDEEPLPFTAGQIVQVAIAGVKEQSHG